MKPGQQLSSLLHRETKVLNHLHYVLEQEYKALSDTDIEAVESATSAKNLALADQTDATISRQNFAAQSCGDKTDEGMRRLIANCDNHNELERLFSDLLQLATQCHDANRINGRLIMKKQQQAQRAINIVRQTDNNLPTYSGQGKATITPSARSFGKA